MNSDTSYEPTDEDVAAIVAVLLREAKLPVGPVRTSSEWQLVARHEAVNRWEQPVRLSRITREYPTT